MYGEIKQFIIMQLIRTGGITWIKDLYSPKSVFFSAFVIPSQESRIILILDILNRICVVKAIIHLCTLRINLLSQ